MPQNTLKIKNCHVITLTGKTIRCCTLPKGDLEATALLGLKAYKPCRQL